MGRVLVISSQVASSRVGASAGRFVLERMGHEVVVLPTVLLGRHPGWGAPGGGAVSVERLRSMWTAIRKQELHFDAVQTGYFANHDQVALAAEIIDQMTPGLVMVDPVIGDDDGMYVAERVAGAIRDELVPEADIITPNQWEHDWLTSTAPVPPGVTELVTSSPDGARIGALYRDPDLALRVSHERFDAVPHGGGDTLAALWLAHAMEGLPPPLNLARSTGSVLALLRASVESDLGEIPLARLQDKLFDPDPLEVTHV